ncbi:LacI family DNA-binding transcriptional regulator [Galbitalea sp. SE-J8]|uniref:LacI family DNA-binding transcriptional regulator n=1 Tax=Galbitalea sp. SE-J8 TaxID=3054952 RepID=UPI00259CBC1A|nr:LacI family DNA-binding transcriptional regulator [Galbitalea sp. SE-J8]MDM4762494.1 LacI family DNA-binding transcriptional regulator [Galbitalea sp. SE-J8]
MTTRPPTIRDVAARAGVSYQTVSRVLNASERIRPETRERVRAAMHELGFRPNPAARALVTSRSGVIGVLATHGEALYGPTASLGALELAARTAGYGVSTTYLASTDAAAIRDGLDVLRRQAVEAIVVAAPQARVFDVVAELSLDLPFVTLDAAARDPRHSLAVDQVAGAELAVRHLIERGHERIVHLAGPLDWSETEGRVRGYRAALAAAGLPAREPIVGDWSSEFGYRAGLELLAHRDFTAVFAGNDQMALGFLHACGELGVDVPRDVSVVGFDDIPDAAHFLPPLTTVRQDFAEVGRRAIAALVAQLGGDPAAEETAPVLPRLISRSSTAARRPV